MFYPLLFKKTETLIFILIFLLGCQSDKSITKVNEFTFPPVQVKTTHKLQTDEVQSVKRKEIRKLLEVFYEGSKKEWNSAKNKLMNMGDIGVEAICIFMLKFFFCSNKNIGMGLSSRDITSYWQAARRELVSIGKLSVPYIIITMSHPKIGGTGAIQCSLTLIDIGNTAVPDLIKNIGHGQHKFQRRVLDTLGKIGDKRSAKPVSDYYFQLLQIEQTKNFDTYDLRYYCIKALGKLKNENGLPAIDKALVDPNDTVVKQALIAILNFDTTKALPTLNRALNITNKKYIGFRTKIKNLIKSIEN